MSAVYKLLLVEDDADWLDLYCDYLKSDEYDIITARTISQAFTLLEQIEFDVVLTDLKMIGFGNDFGGFDVLDRVKKINNFTQVIIITAYGTQERAFKAMQSGASDIVYKTPDHLDDRIRLSVRNAIQLEAVIESKKQKKVSNSLIYSETTLPSSLQNVSPFGILGNSRMMRQAFEKISYAANVNQSVFIFGEKGTGKSYIAKIIHLNSNRKNKTFSSLNFSDLSIHWDSVSKNLHRLSGGTFLVDNMDAFSYKHAKLLYEFFELTEKNNVRLMASLTTSVSDIAQIHRTSGLTLTALDKIMSIPVFVPPLRLRRDGDDIPSLTGNYIHSRVEMEGVGNRISISPKAMAKLVDIDFKKENVVELYALLEKALSLMGPGDEILEEHILITNDDTQISTEKDDVILQVFISYSNDDSVIVDQLQKDLEKFGIKIWRDRDMLFPGSRWKAEIRKAIQSGAFFLACFSKNSEKKSRTYMYEELNLAIEELRMRPKYRAWFIPVKLDECEVPDWDIGGGERLSDIHYLDLFEDWDKGIQKLVTVMKKTS